MTQYFDFENLQAYKQAKLSMQFVAARLRKLAGLPGKSGEQLERAVLGAMTNTASGSSARGAEQKRQFRIALTESSEAGSAIEAALAYGAFSQAEYEECRAILLRQCACLRGLV